MIWNQSPEHRRMAGLKGARTQQMGFTSMVAVCEFPQALTSEEGSALGLRKVTRETKAGHVVSLPYLRFQHGGRL